jgi:pimeloyl-ACP methyl ester carboxylesterase
MSTFVLVHGAWHGAWCWERVSPLLEGEGHTVVAPDLPSLGRDRTPWWRATHAASSRRVRDAARGHDEVILVGHSMGGAAITQAAVDEPELFTGLIYVCAFVPKSGESVLGLANSFSGSRLPDVMRYGMGRAKLRAEPSEAAFYNLCASTDARAACERLRSQPLLPAVQHLRADGDITLPRAYIECSQDSIIPLDDQRRMHERFLMCRTLLMYADHSPFYSAPGELADKILELVPALTKKRYLNDEERDLASVMTEPDPEPARAAAAHGARGNRGR